MSTGKQACWFGLRGGVRLNGWHYIDGNARVFKELVGKYSRFIRRQKRDMFGNEVFDGMSDSCFDGG